MGMEKDGAMEAVRAVAEVAGAIAAENVRARATRKIDTGEKSKGLMLLEMGDKRYPERACVPPREFWKSETRWITSKASKQAGRRG